MRRSKVNGAAKLAAQRKRVAMAADKRRALAEMKCTAPDRDVPALVCGYPMPCPWHTVLVVMKRRRGAR
jgi:hypothetical protein